MPDREANEWKASNPTGYIQWFKQRQKVVKIKMIFDHAAPMPIQEPATEKHTLQLAVQLTKRWRDLHYTENPGLAPISIVLTTLVAHFYDGSQSLIETLLDAADKIVAAIPSTDRLVVLNPANPEEDLSERWEDGNIYRSFVEGIRAFRSQLRQLTMASDIQEAAKLIESMFGETVTKSANHSVRWELHTSCLDMQTFSVWIRQYRKDNSRSMTTNSSRNWKDSGGSMHERNFPNSEQSSTMVPPRRLSHSTAREVPHHEQHLFPC